MYKRDYGKGNMTLKTTSNGHAEIYHWKIT